MNSRGICAVALHCWQANGLGLFAAAEVNWRAARATEYREAIVRAAVCGWRIQVKVHEAWGSCCDNDSAKALDGGELAIGKTRERFPKATTFREGKSATATATGNTKQQVTMLYEMIGVVCRFL